MIPNGISSFGSIGNVGRSCVPCCGLWGGTEFGFLLLIFDRFYYVPRNDRIRTEVWLYAVSLGTFNITLEEYRYFITRQHIPTTSGRDHL